MSCVSHESDCRHGAHLYHHGRVALGAVWRRGDRVWNLPIPRLQVLQCVQPTATCPSTCIQSTFALTHVMYIGYQTPACACIHCPSLRPCLPIVDEWLRCELPADVRAVHRHTGPTTPLLFSSTGRFSSWALGHSQPAHFLRICNGSHARGKLTRPRDPVHLAGEHPAC